ncbi:MAG: glycosyltransferase [Spirochaetaceae bacterium]|jgi:UDP:flavonoid glycosyltransferase YjiC (YdhE family)|nr:glycosyltransferase [Spirochaetaceae bacterium]
MKILLVTRGSQGDIYPYLPLAKELSRRGHTVTLNLPHAFEQFARELGIPYTVQGHDDIIGMLEKSPDTKDILEWTRRVIKYQFDELIPQLKENDILIASNTEFAAASIAEYLKKPFIRTAYAPLMPSKKIPPPVLPFQNPNSLLRPAFWWGVLNTALNFMVKKTLNTHRAALGMPPIRDQAEHAPRHAQNLNLYSPSLGETDEDWPYNWAQAGYCFNDLLPYNAAVYQRLLAFIEGDDRPTLFFTMGSITAVIRERICGWLYEICEEYNYKFIVGCGWSGMGRGLKDEENLFLLNEVIPHKLFLSKCTAIIHHGGSGTTHSAARAGIPQIAAPMLIDQWYWGHRVWRLGLGPKPIKIKRTDKRELAAIVLDLIRNAGYKEKAAALSKTIDGENGLNRACDYIEKNARNTL